MEAVNKEGASAPSGFHLFERPKTFNPDQRDECLQNIEENCQRGLPFFRPGKRKNGSFIIVGGGPSIRDHIDTIRGIKGRIVCLNDSLTFLLEHGIKPWACVFWEVASLDIARYFDDPPDVSYLVASQSWPGAFEALKGRRITVWHAWQGIGEEYVVHRHDPKGVIVAGGCSAGLRAINIGRIFGYEKFHLFGMDSSAGESSHAYYDVMGQGYAAYREYIDIWCAGKTFKTVPYWARQAEDFRDYMKNFPDLDMTVHGEGLLPHIARQLGYHADNRGKS